MNSFNSHQNQDSLNQSLFLAPLTHSLNIFIKPFLESRAVFSNAIVNSYAWLFTWEKLIIQFLSHIAGTQPSHQPSAIFSPKMQTLHLHCWCSGELGSLCCPGPMPSYSVHSDLWGTTSPRDEPCGIDNDIYLQLEGSLCWPKSIIHPHGTVTGSGKKHVAQLDPMRP